MEVPVYPFLYKQRYRLYALGFVLMLGLTGDPGLS
jgi:hypothetical protein